MDDELLRVQVKCAYRKERYGSEKIAVDFRAGRENVPYEEGDTDAFIVYNPMDDELYWLWPEEAPDSHTYRNRGNWTDLLLEVVLG